MIELLYIIFDYIKSIGPTIFIFFIMFIMIRAFVGNMDYKQPIVDDKINNDIDYKQSTINNKINNISVKINNIDDKIDNIKKHNSLIYTEVPHYAYLDHANVLHISKHEDIAKEYGRGNYIPTNIASIHGYPADSKEKYYILTVYQNRIESKHFRSIPKELKNLCIKLRDMQGYYSIVEYI